MLWDEADSWFPWRVRWVGSGSWGVRERLVIESIGGGVCVLDGEGRTVFANPVAVGLVGYGIEALAGRHQHEILRHARADGEAYPLEACPVCGAFRYGESYRTSEEVFYRKDGTALRVGYTSDPHNRGRRGARRGSSVPGGFRSQDAR